MGVLRVSQPLFWLLMWILEGLLPTHKAPVFPGLSESPVAEDGIQVLPSYWLYLLCIRRRRGANDGQEAVMIFSSVKSEGSTSGLWPLSALSPISGSAQSQLVPTPTPLSSG